MDENLEHRIATVNDPVEPQTIPSDTVLYRHIHLKMVSNKKHVPSPTCFANKPQHTDDGLSVDWAQITAPELSLAILGRTYRKDTQELKNPAEYGLYRIEGSYLSQLEIANRTRHDPVFHGDPPRQGWPNNPAHAVVIYAEEDELQMRVKLQNHAKEVEVDRQLIEGIGEMLSAKEQAE